MKPPSNQTAPRAGFTLIELIIVISVIVLLMAVLIAGTTKLRERARLAAAKTLLEKVQTGLESYRLYYRAYPQPMPLAAGYSESQTLYYFLTTPFRMTPDSAKNEVYSSLNAGPVADFKELEIKDLNKSGHPSIVDTWGTPIKFKYIVKTGDADPLLGWTVTKTTTPQIYSCGPNCQDDNAAGDDIVIGEQ